MRIISKRKEEKLRKFESRSGGKIVVHQTNATIVSNPFQQRN